MAKLSVVIVAKNESANIYDCVKSAAFADEILVIDSGSTDQTIRLAKNAGARILKKKWIGYGPQQNIAINASKGDWVFSLDADERISSKLAKEIIKSIKEEEFYVYNVPRKSLFVSRFMGHSGWRPDYTKRLFKKGFAKFTEHEVHAHLSTKYKIGKLANPIIHFSYRDLESVIYKMNLYSTGGARDNLKSGKKGSLRKAIFHGLWAFFRTYFIRAGFLDGREGVMLAIAKAEVTYYRYLKLYYISQKNLKSKINF